MFRLMVDALLRLLETVPSQTRYLYHSFDLRNRLTGLIGARGVGKTTLLLQYLKQELKGSSAFYFSADQVYFQQTTLLEFVDHLYTVEGIRTVFIDEVHKYQRWNQELKNLYDSFPSLKIVFSGSSTLDLVKGSYDLSRRAKLYQLHGLSFREYLNFTLNLDLQPIALQQILEDPSGALKGVKGIDRLLPHFHDYLQRGYYPFFFEDPLSYHEKLARVVEKTIFEDIANYYNLKTLNLPIFKRLLTYLASIPPGELNLHNLATQLGVDSKTVGHYIFILSSVGLVREMRPYEGGGPGLRKPAKLLLNNSNLLHMLDQYLGRPPSKGMERELFFVQMVQNAGVELFYSKKVDYQTRHAFFEIGGRNKKRGQLRGIEGPAYLVKDEIVQPLKGEIPLFLFGFLY